jgi:hypothetical protein
MPSKIACKTPNADVSISSDSIPRRVESHARRRLGGGKKIWLLVENWRVYNMTKKIPLLLLILFIVY